MFFFVKSSFLIHFSPCVWCCLLSMAILFFPSALQRPRARKQGWSFSPFPSPVLEETPGGISFRSVSLSTPSPPPRGTSYRPLSVYFFPPPVNGLLGLSTPTPSFSSTLGPGTICPPSVKDPFLSPFPLLSPSLWQAPTIKVFFFPLPSGCPLFFLRGFRHFFVFRLFSFFFFSVGTWE